MLSDHQIRKLLKHIQRGEPLTTAALKTGMDVKTARKYARANMLPSTLKAPHTWRTREDVFGEVWEDLRQKLDLLPGLEAKLGHAHYSRANPCRRSSCGYAPLWATSSRTPHLFLRRSRAAETLPNHRQGHGPVWLRADDLHGIRLSEPFWTIIRRVRPHPESQHHHVPVCPGSDRRRTPTAWRNV